LKVNIYLIPSLASQQNHLRYHITGLRHIRHFTELDKKNIGHFLKGADGWVLFRDQNVLKQKGQVEIDAN
jgi:hypothetical protein